MKNLKKFNENWIEQETEDTNRRMSELDQEEGLNDDQGWEDDKVSPFENNIITLLNDADEVLSAKEFAQLAKSIIDSIDDISRSKR